MKFAYTHTNPLLVGNAPNLIKQASIAVTRKNQFATSYVDELSAFELCWNCQNEIAESK